MELRWISLKDVARLAHVPYARASRLLGGREVDAASLTRLRKVILDTPTPTP